MKKLFAIIAVAAVATAAQAEVVEDWLIKGGSGAASGNTWIDTANAGRGLDFIPSSAALNTFGEDVIAVQDGVGATNNIHIMAADNGQHLANFAMTATGDATLEHYRVATSEDGYIFVNGFGGTIQQYTPAGGTPLTPITASTYSAITPAVTGASRALEVTGNVALGTAKIFVGRATTVVVFANSPGNTTTFDYVGQIATGHATDVASIASHDGLTVFTSPTGGTAIKKFTLVYSPSFSFTANGDVAGFGVFVKQGLAVNATNSLMGIAEAGGAQDGFAIADVSVDGLTVTNIAPAAGLDGDADAVYDAGAWNLDCSNATDDICMDPVSGEVWGLSSSVTASPTASAGVMNLRAVANVGEWNLY